MKHYCSFSEAMAAGIPLSPQTTAVLQDDTGATCSIGAGLRAIGLRYIDTTLALEQLARMYPYIKHTVACPACEAHDDEVGWIAVCLNDAHGWSRERVKDWVERYEESIGFVTIEVTEDKTPSSIQSVGERVGV